MSQSKNRGLLKILIVFFVVSIIFWLMPASLGADDATDIELLQAELDAANLALEEAQGAYDTALADLEALQNDPEATEEALADAQAAFDAAVLALADAEAAVLAAQEALDAAMNSNGSEQNDENDDDTGQEEEVIPEETAGSGDEEVELDPVLSTDKADYSPGENVTIFGTGFAPETSYVIEVLRPDGSIVKGDGSFEPGSDSVTSDADGSFVYNYILNGIAGLYSVSAFDSDGAVLASTSFTDCNNGQIVIHKSGLLDSDEATFTVTGPNYSNSKTRGNQTISFSNLPPGDYYVVETWPESNKYCYKQNPVVSEGPYSIDDNRIDIDIVNKAKGYMRIIKDGLLDDDEAIFTVSNGDGFSMEKQFGNGEKVYGPLPKGTFTVTETYPGTNLWEYTTEYDESTEYTISCDNTYVVVSITNIPQKGKIIINKSGLLCDDEATFTLTYPDGHEESITTGNGTIEFTELEDGDYYVVETWPSSNMYCYKQNPEVSEGPYTVQYGGDVTIDVVNKARGYMRIIKSGLEDCDEAIFTVSNGDGFSMEKQFGNGEKVYGPLPKGNYTITETFPGDNVWLYDTDHDDATQYVISCDDTYEAVSIINTARKGKIEITKSGLMEGDEAIFHIYGPDDFEYSEVMVNETVLIDGLYYGEYTIEEEWPEENEYCYKIKSITPEGPYDVQDCTVEIDVVNKVKGQIKIIKSGLEDGDMVTFTLDGPGDFEESYTMGNGSHKFKNLPKGSYVITEESECGNNWAYDVSYDPEGPYVIDCDNTKYTVNIENTAKKGSVEIFKTDATSGLPLGGSTFQLFIEGSWIQIGSDVVLGDDGHYIWEDLEYGHYMLVEAVAPEGYLVEGPLEFDISPEGELNFVFKEEIADPRIPGTITIFKYAGGDPLEGAEFDVTNGDGFAVKVVTGADGTATLTGLAWDTYYIKEVSVPDPTLYEINPNQFEVTISRFNLSDGVDVENDIIVTTPTPTPAAAGIEVLGISEELPFTGMNMYIPISGAGVVLAGIAMFIASIRRKKK